MTLDIIKYPVSAASVNAKVSEARVLFSSLFSFVNCYIIGATLSLLNGPLA